jgi:hypothetical protein
VADQDIELVSYGVGHLAYHVIRRCRWRAQDGNPLARYRRCVLAPERLVQEGGGPKCLVEHEFEAGGFNYAEPWLEVSGEGFLLEA